MQLSEKSESASLCLQGLGAEGVPSLLISQPEFIHSFLTEGYVYMVLFKWMWVTFAHPPSWLAACRYGRWHSQPNWEAGSRSPWRHLAPHWDSPCHPLHLVPVSPLSSERGQRPLHRPSHCPCGQLPFSRAERWCPQPGHSGQLEHSSSQRCSLDSGSWFQWSGCVLMYRDSASVEKSLKIQVHYPHLCAVLDWYYSV